MNFDFDTPIDRRGTASSKWDKYAGRDILPMWVADMDFRSPPEVVEALKGRAEHGVFGYTHPPGELVDCIESMCRRQYGWAIEPEWIVWLPGLGVGLNLVCRAVAGRGDDVLTMTPIYPPFLAAPKKQGCNLVTVPLGRDDNGRWVMDLAALGQAIGPRSRLLLLCNPHNPVGRLYWLDELAALVSICHKHNLVVCSDEIHCGLILDEGRRHVPTAVACPEMADRTITLMAPSKTFNLPGLHCAFAIIPGVELREALNKAKKGLVPEVSIFGYTGALAAYRHGRQWHRALLAYLRGNREVVERMIGQAPGLEMAHVEATYLAWIDVRGLERDNAVAFFEAAGVGLSDGGDFGLPGFVRLNFGCPRSRLIEALNRMRRAAGKP
ncbi:MAG: putative C-S lyase [Anaerolineaceae bacterium]|nr:putative C-S lyase [Anaerolineaceae bacterium]